MRMHDYSGHGNDSKRSQLHGRRRFGEERRHQKRYYRHHRGGTGGGGYEGRGSRFFKRGEFKFALLELLASEPMHGYQLIKAMEEKTGGMYTPSAGSIYPNLQLLEDMQLVGVSEADGKKLYHITDEGRNHLQERKQTAEEGLTERWERRGMRRPTGAFDKRDLRNLVMQWPEVVATMAQAAKVYQQNPDSEQALQLQEIMERLQENIQKAIAPAASTEDASTHVDKA